LGDACDRGRLGVDVASRPAGDLGDDSGHCRGEHHDVSEGDRRGPGIRCGATHDHSHIMIGRLEVETFRAMGTSCAIAVAVRPGDARRARRALDAARAEIAACERDLSRFDPESDLMRLNRAGGAWLPVGIRLRTALRAALIARAATAGRYDPTVLPALVAAGYDTSFDALQEREPIVVDDWRAGGVVEIDEAAGTARLDAGVAVDLGGIGKGWSAGRAVAAMRDAWPALGGAFVDLGGDVALAGVSPDGGLWRIGVADPRREGRTLGTLLLTGGAVATSGRDRRRFGPGRRLHHLIDPQTGTSAGPGPLTVTVVGSDPADTEAHATALAIGTIDDASRYLRERPHLAALIVPEEGPPTVIGQLPFQAAAAQGAVA
jgi:thiamine biosynthesis lipoprotein